MNLALDIALGDIGAWGLGAIGALTFLANRAVDRARLVNPPRQQASAPDAAKADSSPIPFGRTGT